jgi:hypothetical protein
MLPIALMMRPARKAEKADPAAMAH